MTLFEIRNQALQNAKLDTKVYDDSDDTYHFVNTLWAENSYQTAFKVQSAICIFILRKNECHSIWLKTFKFIENTNIENNFQYITKVIKELAKLQIKENFHLFTSVNSFLGEKYCNSYKPSYARKGSMVFKAKVISLDLDFNKLDDFKNLSYDQSIDKIICEHKEIFEKFTPMIVRSGGGCQLYFILNHVLNFTTPNKVYHLGKTYFGIAADDSKKNIFYTLSTALNLEFANAGSDFHCKNDLARIFRPPFSINIKYDIPVFVSITKRGSSCKRKELFEWATQKIVTIENEKSKVRKEATPKKPKPTTSSKSRKSTKVISSFPEIPHTLKNNVFRNFVKNRMIDIETVSSSNKMEGVRTSSLFVYLSCLRVANQDEALSLKFANRLNDFFDTPLTASEVQSVIASTKKVHYFISNKYIFEQIYKPLGIDISKLLGNYSTKRKPEATKKNNSKRAKSKKFSSIEKIEFVKANPQMSAKELAKILDCTDKTIYRIKKNF